jgi:hypothetical protein
LILNDPLDGTARAFGNLTGLIHDHLPGTLNVLTSARGEFLCVFDGHLAKAGAGLARGVAIVARGHSMSLRVAGTSAVL